LQALPKVDEIVKTAKKKGMEAVALTDNGNLYGAIEFFKECKKAEIKPIIGVDAYMAARGLEDKQVGFDKSRTRMVLLAKDEVGYKNLLELVTISHLKGFYYKPRLDIEALRKYGKGLVAISSAWSGDISTALRGHDEEKAKFLADTYKEIFGDDFYIELTMHPEISGHNEHMKVLYDFAKKENIQVVGTHDVYYIEPGDRRAWDTLMAVQQGGEGLDKARTSFDEEDEDFSFLGLDEIAERFKDFPEALANNEAIIDKCNLTIELGKWVFPKLDLPSHKSPDDELRDLAFEGIEKRGLPKSEEIINRLEYELGVIKTKGYSPYFLVVADLLRFARENGIFSNIRGSVSGSLVTYTSGITNINPLEYEIPFERFLNPDRPSAPDIDMDYADNRRDEMVEYVRHKYGESQVAQIGTFGTMMARGSVRDTARALGFPYAQGDRIAKLIPMGAQGFPMTIDRALDEVPELKELYDTDEDTKTIIDMAKKIEGCARHISIHAAGVVIAPTELTDFTALQYDPKGENKIITQYDMYSIEDAGLLKFDFLGLKNLSIISAAMNLAKHTKGADLHPDTVPIDDRKTFEMLARGETADLFQLNGDGMTRFLVELKPSTIHDINAMVALYRPGPMQFIPNYIERKHDPSKVTYLDPALEPILKKTYGILVYQDDLLMMAHKLAGYTWGEVDKFRKAVGKKIPEEMREQKEKFIKGCMKHSGWSEKKANEIWKWIEPFAAYGFNKAHSVSYGRVAYQTAYLKANFPGEYMTSVLSAESGDTEKVAETVAECKRMGIDVLPPDINESFREFTLLTGKSAGNSSEVYADFEASKSAPVLAPPRSQATSESVSAVPHDFERIRFGLGSIKNFGEGIADFIIAERKKGGPFKTIEEFLSRVHDRNLNKKSLEALIKSGAMDALGERGKLLHNLDRLLEYNKESQSGKGQSSLFGALSSTGYSPLYMEDVPPVSQDERLLWEKELLGLYISGHPLDKFKEKLESRDKSIKTLKETSKENEVVVVGGLVEQVKEFLTKGGDKMLFVRIADYTDSIEMVVFPRTLEEFKNVIVLDQCIAVKAKVSLRNGEKSLIVEKAKKL
jgi:DNA polymerase-3 subunit alpha